MNTFKGSLGGEGGERRRRRRRSKRRREKSRRRRRRRRDRRRVDESTIYLNFHQFQSRGLRSNAVSWKKVLVIPFNLLPDDLPSTPSILIYQTRVLYFVIRDKKSIECFDPTEGVGV